ncbi:MAG: PAS-domain containing protein, partial [Rubrivivax sp.]|nr:PAS-domain containing protein [Rubrivivax sp.]
MTPPRPPPTAPAAPAAAARADECLEAGGDAAADADADARARAVLRDERVRLYRAGRWSAIGGQCVMASLVLWVVHAHVPSGPLALWLGLVVLSMVARALCHRGALPQPRGDAAATELARVRAALLGMGAAFGSSAWLIFPAGDFQSQVFLAFMMAGLAAGALTLSSFDLRFALAFAVIVLVPIAVRLVATGMPPAVGVGVATAIFVFFLALNGARAQRNLCATLAVREADAQRTASLLESQRRLEQTSAELRRASEELRLTFEHMDQGIFCLGPDGRTGFYNRRMCELTGLPEAFMATRPTGAEISRYQSEHGHFGRDQELFEVDVRQRLRRWREGGEAPFPQGAYFRRTHLGRVLDVKTAPLPGGGYLRTFADVTALFEANERLRESEAQARKLALVAAHTDNAVLITDPGLRIEWVNEGFTRLTGYTLAEAVGRRTAELLRGPGTDRSATARMDAELEHELRTAGEVLHYRKDGSAYWYAFETSAIRGEDGQVQHFIGVGRDVTARHEAEQALRAARDEAERASRAKSDFLSAMSHELRTPLNAILGFAQLLEADTREPLPARQREHVGRIREAGAHLLDLINDVLDLARVEAGREVIALEPVAPAPLVDECLVLMRPLAGERGIEVVSEVGPGAPRVRADRMRLKQVLLNLLANAIKYNRPHGAVHVRCVPATSGDEGPPGTVRLEVVDTGPGLDEQARQRIFNAFERLGAERGPVEGAGIGLALSRRLVALMHGTIEVSSEPGRGSTFAVSL